MFASRFAVVPKQRIFDKAAAHMSFAVARIARENHALSTRSDSLGSIRDRNRFEVQVVLTCLVLLIDLVVHGTERKESVESRHMAVAIRLFHVFLCWFVRDFYGTT
jgi:hypothetical protein